jgi:hypothetical protein
LVRAARRLVRAARRLVRAARRLVRAARRLVRAASIRAQLVDGTAHYKPGGFVASIGRATGYTDAGKAGRLRTF